MTKNLDIIERMVQEAEENAATDTERRELAEARNQAESLIHATEKTLVEHGDKISSDEKSAIEADIAALK